MYVLCSFYSMGGWTGGMGIQGLRGQESVVEGTENGSEKYGKWGLWLGTITRGEGKMKGVEKQWSGRLEAVV